MELREQFSVAICPQDDIVEYVSLIKKDLRKVINSYASINSEAHMTFNTFWANERELCSWKTYINKFCNHLIPFEIRFDSFSAFPPKTLFLAPDEESNKVLRRMLKEFHNNKLPNQKGKVRVPHMTIARELSEEEMMFALDYLKDKNFNLEFTCNDLVIRKLDYSIEQYRVEYRFPFKGEVRNDLFA
ncbi:MAG: 2'-5' RNA ligase family protein [Bacteroidetes bacterium]|nr:2'-5' RNA ligase family protein [Bacteroidota bacterium]